MARSLSLYRRRAGLVDLTLQARPGIAAYQFQSATNFDAAPATFATVPAAGMASKSVQDLAMDGSSKFRGQTRFLFSPADYSLIDTNPLWFCIKQIPVVGAGVSPTPAAAEALHLVLPYSSSPDRPIVLNGTAPAGSTIADSKELQLPGQCRNLQIQVNGSIDMWVAFEPGGQEFRIPALSNQFTNFQLIAPVVSQIFIRGDSGSPTQFNAVMGLRNNPLG